MTRMLSLAIIVALTAALSTQQAPVFRTAVQLVTVDVVVTDADDRPVKGLTKDDFEIVDRGRPQTVSDFRFLDIPLTRTELADLKALPRAPDVASNVSPSPDSRLFVLIVDTLHTLESEIVPMKQVMTEFIQSISPLDEVAIVFPNRSDLGTNFTTDRQRMLAAVEDVRAASGFAIDALGFAATAAGRGPIEGDRAGRGLAFTLKHTALALAGSAHPRRAIVLVGAGSPANMSGNENTRWLVFEEFKDVYQTARESNVPIYALDPRGMVVLADAVRRPGGSGSSTGNGVSFGLGYQKDNLHVAAVNTGGRAFVDQSNITGAMQQLIADNGSVYLLSYYPDTAPLTDRFNEIEVKVKRPGLKVRARAGYHAAGVRATSDLPISEQLNQAMTSALDQRGLSLQATVAPLLPTGDKMRTAVTIRLSYPTTGGADRPFDSLRVQVLALDGDAKVKGKVERAYTVRPPQPGMTDRDTAVLIINEAIDLPSQPLTLRIGVVSQSLGRTGTLQIPVHAPKPSDSRIQMGAVVIGVSAGAGPSTLGADLIKGMVPFQPSTRRTFRPEQTLRIFAPIFWKGRETEATVTLTLEGTGVTLRREEKLTVARPTDGRRVTSLDTLIPLAQLNGAFTLTLDASVKDGQAAARTVAFEVRSAGAPEAR